MSVDPWKTNGVRRRIVLACSAWFGGAVLLLSPTFAAADAGAAADLSAFRSSAAEVRDVAPALARFGDETVLGKLWARPGLNRRDRSIVTLSAVLARGQLANLARYVNLALDNDVRPGEVSEIVTHLAFYAGWETALSAIPTIRQVFADRKVGAETLPTDHDPLLPHDEAAEARRAARVDEQFSSVAPGLVRHTSDLLFNDLWLRPGLSPRARSIVTVSALVATGQSAQLASHLNRAMDNGVTRTEAGEMLTQLAFFAGWPATFTAIPIAKDVFAKRPRSDASVAN